MTRRAARFRSFLLALLLLVPLIIGAVITATADLQPARSWSAGEPAAAPAADSPASIDPAELVDARRAASEAGTQAGFLTSGTEELSEGTGQLRDGADELAVGVEEAKTGAQQLHNGMIELQAATGQLGNGATELADGVGGAVDQIVGLGVIQGQILTAIDTLDEDLADEDEPRIQDLRRDLAGFRDQVATVDLGGGITDQLNRLKDGSREIANQLAVPGYGFHDGMYSATDGARQLNEGLGMLQGGVGEAVDGVDQLDDGAQRIDQMAQTNQDQLTTVQRSLPAVQAPAADATEESVDPAASLAPMYALLIGALAVLGGVAVGFIGRGRWLDILLGIVGVVALSGVFFALLAQGFGTANLAVAIGLLTLMTTASTGLTLVLRRVAGDRWGGVLSMAGAIIQVGVVGWVWQTAAGADIGTIWQVIAALTPLHHITGALAATGNAGDPLLVWLGAGVLAGVALVAFVAVALGRRRAAAAAA